MRPLCPGEGKELTQGITARMAEEGFASGWEDGGFGAGIWLVCYPEPAAQDSGWDQQTAIFPGSGIGLH